MESPPSKLPRLSNIPPLCFLSRAFANDSAPCLEPAFFCNAEMIIGTATAAARLIPSLSPPIFDAICSIILEPSCWVIMSIIPLIVLPQ